MTKPTSSPIDITNQKLGAVGSAAAGMRAFHRQQFRYECASERARVRAPGHVTHEQRLENRPAEGEAENVFDDDLGQAGKPEHAREYRARQDTDAVTGDAMHGRSQRLPPARGNVAFVEPWQWLRAAEHIEERADHAGISGQ